jgi:hypothetical protein
LGLREDIEILLRVEFWDLVTAKKAHRLKPVPLKAKNAGGTPALQIWATKTEMPRGSRGTVLNGKIIPER